MAHANIDAPDCRCLGLPQFLDLLTVMAAHPVAQEARGQVHGDFIAIDARQSHLPQPGAVFDVPNL